MRVRAGRRFCTVLSISAVLPLVGKVCCKSPNDDVPKGPATTRTSHSPDPSQYFVGHAVTDGDRLENQHQHHNTKYADDRSLRPPLLSSPPPRSSSPIPTGSLAGGLDYDLGKYLGLTHGHEVPTSVVQSVIQSADQGNRDSLYFLGLLKLYGISVSPDAVKALELIRKSAELRHLEAMAALGVMLLNGKGGSRDYGAAAAWFRLAANEGHVEAMWLFGRMYCEGKGVHGIDYDEANKWFHRAAAEGSPRGQHHLGVAHEYGSGVSQNLREAARWYSLAAAQGLAESNYHLGLMKAHGRGFAQDFNGAAIHFQKGAQQHHAPSMMYLGRMCLYGQGFPVDYDMALLWFEKVAEEGTSPLSDEAAAARDELRASLLEAQRVNDNLVAGYDYGVVPGRS